MRIGICDDIREEVEKQEKQVRQITYQMGIRADIRKCYSGMDLLMEKLISDVYEKLQIDDKFAFKSNKTYYNISLNKIMYFMSEKRITNVYFIDKICTFYGKMNDIEINLRKKQVDFWRIHHSFLVNPRYIEEYHYDKVVLQNGISLEISRAKRENTRLMYMRKLGK